MDFQRLNENIIPEVRTFMKKRWRSELMISKGRVYTLGELEGYGFFEDQKLLGLITFNVLSGGCQIISLDSLSEGRGIGSMLISLVEEQAQIRGCSRIWVVTTNDNTKALRFYQKRGFTLCGFYENSVDMARQIKPEVPIYGQDNIPIKHEFELEYRL